MADIIDLAARFREAVAPIVLTDPDMVGRLAEARAWYPGAFAAVDTVLAEAHRLYPDCALGMAAIGRVGWQDQALIRIGPVEFLVDPIELAYDVHSLAPRGLPRAGDREAEAEFGKWFADALGAAVRKRVTQ